MAIISSGHSVNRMPGIFYILSITCFTTSSASLCPLFGRCTHSQSLYPMAPGATILISRMLALTQSQFLAFPHLRLGPRFSLISVNSIAMLSLLHFSLPALLRLPVIYAVLSNGRAVPQSLFRCHSNRLSHNRIFLSIHKVHQQCSRQVPYDYPFTPAGVSL